MARRMAVLVFALLLAVLTTHPASAARGGADRPVKADLSGVITFEYDWSDALCPVTTVTETTGTMSHLGAVTASWQHCAAVALPYYTNGLVTFTAANGDTLEGRYDEVTDDDWPVNIVGGTGRFDDAAGTIYLVQYDAIGEWGEDGLPVQPWSWDGTLRGVITY